MKSDYERLHKKAKIALDMWLFNYPLDAEEIAVLHEVVNDLKSMADEEPE